MACLRRVRLDDAQRNLLATDVAFTKTRDERANIAVGRGHLLCPLPSIAFGGQLKGIQLSAVSNEGEPELRFALEHPAGVQLVTPVGRACAHPVSPAPAAPLPWLGSAAADRRDFRQALMVCSC